MIKEVGLAPIPGVLHPRLAAYAESLLAEFDRLGVKASTGHSGEVYWDPYCANGIFPQTLPPLGAALPVAVTLHSVGPWALSVRECYANAQEAASGVVAQFSQLPAWLNQRWRLDRLIVPSRATADEAAEFLGCPSERIEVIPHGVDHVVFRPDGPTLDREVGFLCIADGYPTQNIHRLLDAWSRLPREGRPPLTLIQPGYRGPAPPAGVVVIDEAPASDLLAAYYRSAVALVHPYLSDSFAPQIAEAMACACPVAASGLPALRETYGDSFRGFDPRDTETVVDAMQVLSGSAGCREDIAGAGRERVQRYTWEASARAYLTVLEQARTDWCPGLRQGRAVLVLGMHRGGTSATAGALERAGVDFGLEQLQPSEDNPGGYHEPWPVIQVDEAILAARGGNWHTLGPGIDEETTQALAPLRPAGRLALRRSRSQSRLWGLKDPRMARMLPFWRPILNEAAEQVSAVIVARHPKAVAASLGARDGMSSIQAVALWTDHMLGIERDTADLPRIVVLYDDLVNAPQATLARIAMMLDIPDLDIDEGVDAITGGWRHHDESALSVAPSVLNTAYEVWRYFVEEAKSPGHRPAGFDACHLAWSSETDTRPRDNSLYADWQRTQAFVHQGAIKTPCQSSFLLHAVCIVPEGREQSVHSTVESLLAQSEPVWRLTVIAEGAIESIPDDERVAVHPAGRSAIKTANGLLSNSDSTWVGLVDAGDRLHPHAVGLLRRFLAERPQLRLVYTDEDQVIGEGQRSNPHFKPDFNLELLRSLPYTGGLMLVREDIARELRWGSDLFGAEEHDLCFRVLDHCGVRTIGHLPDVLYHREPNSHRANAEMAETVGAVQRGLEEHLKRTATSAQILPGPFPASYRVQYPLDRTPRVSVLIPTRDQFVMLQRCVENLIGNTDYPDLEVILIDNGTTDPEAKRFLSGLRDGDWEASRQIRLLSSPGPFNYSALINCGAQAACGEYLLLLDNDTAVLQKDWLRELMRYALQPEVGAVGPRLLSADGRLQQAGLVLANPAARAFAGQSTSDVGYFGRAQLVQEWSALPGSCLLVSKKDFASIGGFDEKHLPAAFGDLDFCLKLGARGRRLICIPHVSLLHEGAKSRRDGVDGLTAEQRNDIIAREGKLIYERWGSELAHDPAYNPNLTLRGQCFVPEPTLPAARIINSTKVPRILCHNADEQGSGLYRVIAPAKAISEAGLAEAIPCLALPNSVTDIERTSPDVVVLQRPVDDSRIEVVRQYRQRGNVFCVMELDDLISNLPLASVHRSDIPKAMMPRMRETLKHCDRLVVATEYLADAYRHLAAEVVVRPNYLQRSVWGHFPVKERPIERRPRVGWAGGASHAGDLTLIVSVVTALADKVDWIFFGMCPEQLRPYAKELYPGVPIKAYPETLASLDLDLGLAPLEQVPFNRGKSNLRLLEYGACGYPVIATDIDPYRCGLPVTLVGNRPREWVRAVREHLSDREALRRKGDFLRDTVLRDWMLEDHLDELAEAWLPERKVFRKSDVIAPAGNTLVLEMRQESRKA